MQVAKWGNSLAVRLPKKLVDSLRLKEGDDIELVAGDAGKFIVMADHAKQSAMQRMRDRPLSLPENYRFDREEANIR